MISRGIAGRIALAAIASAVVGLVILAVGVAVVGANVFAGLMLQEGGSADHAREMYDESVSRVIIAATVVAVLASVGLAIVLARMLAKPLAEIGAAARRIADGDYAARVPREGPEELASLANSFNQMAVSLERQEAMRRDFIANAAHELRTPLTNLQGYLEALRDGVITADRSTYESLHEEAERLVRLSRSLDALAEGDAGTSPDAPVDLDLAEAIRTATELAMPSIERAGLRLDVDVPETLPPTPIPTGWRRCSPTCCRTPCATRRRAARSRSVPNGGRATSSCPSRTPATGSLPVTSIGCSSGSIASRSRATVSAAVPGSGSRS